MDLFSFPSIERDEEAEDEEEDVEEEDGERLINVWPKNRSPSLIFWSFLATGGDSNGDRLFCL